MAGVFDIDLDQPED
nr:Chain T, Ribosomal protein S6 kinase beta-1 [Homo sapiens]